MNVFLEECRKILNPARLVAVLALLLIAAFVFPGSFRNYSEEKSHFAEAEEMSPSGDSEVFAADLLLKEYGPEIDKTELSSLKTEIKNYRAGLTSAIRANGICQKYHITTPNELRHATFGEVLGKEYVKTQADGSARLIKHDAVSDFFENIEQQNLTWHGKNYCLGVLSSYEDKLSEITGDYPTGFNGERAGELPLGVYHVMSMDVMTQFCSDMSESCFIFVLLAILGILPYFVTENRSGTIGLFCTTKKGRKLLRTRFLAVFAVSALLLSVGAAGTILRTKFMGFGRFDNCVLGDALYRCSAMGQTPAVFQKQFITSVPFGVLTILVPVMAAVCGLALCMAAAFVSLRLKSFVTSAIAALPIAGLLALFTYRYIAVSFAMYSKPLLFPAEGIVGSLILLLLTIISAVILLKNECRREILA